jgi:hypothetical protein
MTMLEYTKMILDKVSFEPKIFRKELRKAVNYISKEEYNHLKSWVRQKFGGKSKTSQKYGELKIG